MEIRWPSQKETPWVLSSEENVSPSSVRPRPAAVPPSAVTLKNIGETRADTARDL